MAEWQTRQTQNLLPVREWGFKSLLGHQHHPQADTMEISYRQLGPQDVDSYQSLLMRALKEEPHAFTDDPEELRHMPKDQVQQRLSESFLAGVFDGRNLVGMAGYFIHREKKYSHRGYVHGVYLAPEYRGKRDRDERKIARHLLGLVMDHARGRVEHLELSVNAASPDAVAF